MAELAVVTSTPLGDSLARLHTLDSSYVGIVRALHRPFAAPDDPALATVTCELADSEELIGRVLDANAGAASADRQAAVAAALGEAVERYSGAYLPAETFVLATAEELGPEAAAPERFALFREDQHAGDLMPARPFTRSTRVRWVRGFVVPSGEPAWLPVQLVFLTALPPVPGEELIGFPTSNGLACAATLEEAIVAGLLELVERDAFMITWKNRLSLPRIRLPESGTANAFHRRFLKPLGMTYEVVDLSVFHRIPTILALVRGGADQSVALAVGAASAVRPADAWRKAVIEAFLVRAWARALRLAAPDRTFEAPFEDVACFADHVHLYALPQHAKRAAFLTASNDLEELSEIEELDGSEASGWIDAVVRRLEPGCTPVYAVDVTAPDIRRAGLRVAKVVAPELCALDVAHAARLLGGRRLYEAAFALGLRDRPLSWNEVNPDPHPFP